MKRAVFLDRDGVLNANVFYPDTQRWEAPRDPEAFQVLAGVPEALQRLHGAGFALFVVSNQPNVASGKTSQQEFAAMQDELRALFRRAAVPLAEAFYCTHDPQVSGACACRKPSPYFLQLAALRHGIPLRASWMVGDRVTDMRCGRRAGVSTAWVRTGQELAEPETALYDVCGESLPSVVEGLLRSPGKTLPRALPGVLQAAQGGSAALPSANAAR